MKPAGRPGDFGRPAANARETLAALSVDPELGLSAEEARSRLARDGPNDVPERRSHPLLRFARKFWGLSAWMLELIGVLSLALHKRADAWVALGLLIVNAGLSHLQELRASSAVAALRRRLRVDARVLRDGTWRTVAARELVRGDILRLRAGDYVPADLQVVEGSLRVDQSVLTGESQQLSKTADDALYSASTVRGGEATGVVVATGLGTYFGRTTELVQSAHPKLHIEAVVSRLVKWLATIVGVLAAVTLAVSLTEGLPVADILPLCLVLLMGAVPIALPVMFTVSMALGSMQLARHGVLVTRLNAVEDAANMDVVCADKTGTLTMNRLSLADALAQPGFTAEQVIRDAALASSEADRDPIDSAFLQAASQRRLLEAAVHTVSFVPFSPETRRTEAVIEWAGRKRRVVKGALGTVAAAAGLEAEAVRALEARASRETERGFRVLAVAAAEDAEPLRLVGLAFLHDPLRADSGRLIEELRDVGVGVKMLTGDALQVAAETARTLGLGEIGRAPELRAAGGGSATQAALAEAAGGFAEVFPEDKFAVVRALQDAGHVVGMTGDGVNDAPALRQAEVGIAVSGATDVAKAAASVVLTTEGLEGIVGLVRNGRAIYQRVLTWIINKISRTILKSGLVVIAFLVTGKFVISALGMLLLVFMTDFAKTALSTDRVHASSSPETWNIKPLVKLAVLLGLFMLAEALGLLYIGWHRFGLGSAPGRLDTFTFQTLLYFGLFSIVSIRERGPFWASRPSAILAAALVADACVGALIGLKGFAELRPLPVGQTAFVIAFAAVSAFGVNDFVKRVYASPRRRARVPGQDAPRPPHSHGSGG